MTRARDLADSADKDIAGTLTLDGLTVGTDNTGFGVSHSTASSTATNLTFYTTNGSATAILEFTHSGHGLSVGDLVNVGSSSVTSWLTTWGIFDLTSIADEVEVTETTSTTFRVNITCTSVQTSSASLGQGGSYVYYKGTTTVNSGKTTITGGNVGIGTDTPSKKLVISSSGVNGIEINPDDPTTSTNRILSYNRSTSAFTPLSIGADDIRFYIEDAEKMRIDTSGRVGIGTTSPYVGGVTGNGSLNVLHSTTGQWVMQGRADVVNANGLFIRAGDSSSDTTALFTGRNEANVHMKITGDGNVGIGTTNPERRLHVHSGTSTGTAKFSSALGGAGASANVSIACSGIVNNGLNLRMNGSSATVVGGALAASVYNQENAPLLLGTNNTERMRIDSSGRVTMPYQPAFLAYMDNTSTSHSGGTDYSDIFTDWTGTNYNTGSHFVLSTGRFTAPVSGKYFFSAAIALHTGQQNNNDWAGLNLLINGTALDHKLAAFGEQISDSANWGNRAYRLSLVLSLNASDYVELSMDSMDGTGQTFRGSFSGYLLG